MFLSWLRTVYRRCLQKHRLFLSPGMECTLREAGRRSSVRSAHSVFDFLLIMQDAGSDFLSKFGVNSVIP